MTVTVARTEDDVRALREAWSRMGFSHIDADLDVFLSVARTRDEVSRPHVVTVHGADGPEAMAVARLEVKELPARFGYATILRPRVRCLTVVAGGTAGPVAAEDVLVDALLQALAEREADVLCFHRLRVGSPLHALATRRPPAIRRQRFATREVHWAFDLPGSAAELPAAMPKSVRDNLGRYSRRLQRRYGDRMTLRRYDAAEHTSEAIDALEAVASVAWQRGLGAGFRADRDGELVRLGLRQGWFRAWVLSLDGVPVAFEYGVVRAGVFTLGAKGYDPAHAKEHVGKVVQLGVLEDLSDDPAVHAFDFGPGDADYKRKLGNRSWEDCDVLVYGRTLRALRANVGATAVLGADRMARRLAGENRIARVKRRWRTLRTPATAG